MADSQKPPNRLMYVLSVASVLFGCALIYSLIAFAKGGPTAILAAIAKSGFAAAFSLIFVSEIGDKTFFIAALLAIQYEKGLVLLGSMGALSLMTILSVVIGRIFHSVPAQFQTKHVQPCQRLFLKNSLVVFHYLINSDPIPTSILKINSDLVTRSVKMFEIILKYMGVDSSERGITPSLEKRIEFIEKLYEK